MPKLSLRTLLILMMAALINWQAAGPAAAARVAPHAQQVPVEQRIEVYVLRGGLGRIFSTGMSDIVSELNAQGIPAAILPHDRWRRAAEAIIRTRQGGGRRSVILVGHSLGANAALKIAARLQQEGITVSYLATMGTFRRAAVPSNVLFAENFYLSHGLGAMLTEGASFTGKLMQYDYSGKPGVRHFNMDSNEEIRERIVAQVKRALH